VTGEVQQGGVEADGIATSFQDGAFQIVVQDDTRNPDKGLERRDVAAQEVLHAGIEAVAQEDLPRVAQHHHERHQRTPRPADLQMAEMAPVHLRLLAR